MAEPLQEGKDLTKTDQAIHSILRKISDALDVPVDLLPMDGGPEGKVMPYFDINGMKSKLEALMVYVGMNAQPVSPPYMRVHADVEYWKKKFAAIE